KGFVGALRSSAAEPAQDDREGPVERRVGLRLAAEEPVATEARTPRSGLIDGVMALQPKELGRRSGHQEADVVAHRDERQRLGRWRAVLAERAEAEVAVAERFVQNAEFAGHHGVARDAVGAQLVRRQGGVVHWRVSWREE